MSRAGARLRDVAMLRLYDYIPFEATCTKTTLVPPSHSVHASCLGANFPKSIDQSPLGPAAALDGQWRRSCDAPGGCVLRRESIPATQWEHFCGSEWEVRAEADRALPPAIALAPGACDIPECLRLAEAAQGHAHPEHALPVPNKCA